MSRSTFDVPTPYSPEQVNDILTRFISANGYKMKMRKGEQILQKGGFWVAARCLKVVIGPGNVHIEAWIKSFGEQKLEGVIGVIPKQILQNEVNSLMTALNPPPPREMPQ